VRTWIFSLFILAASMSYAGDAETPSVKQSSPKPICYFIPPKGWEIAQLLHPSSFIQVGFLGKGSSLFRPSINLAFEEVDEGLKEYAKAVKEIHLSDPGIKCRDLGKFPMKAGEGRLLELSSNNPGGEIKQFQALFVKDKIAYILTAAILKEDLPKLQSEVIQSLQSLNLVSDLYSSISDKDLKTELQAFAAGLDLSIENKKKNLESLDKTLAEKCPQLGAYWRYLMLTEAASKNHQ